MRWHAEQKRKKTGCWMTRNLGNSATTCPHHSPSGHSPTNGAEPCEQIWSTFCVRNDNRLLEQWKETALNLRVSSDRTKILGSGNSIYDPLHPLACSPHSQHKKKLLQNKLLYSTHPMFLQNFHCSKCVVFLALQIQWLINRNRYKNMR